MAGPPPSSSSKLDALEKRLEQHGDDPRRLDMVHRAQRFKRSWVELAEGLIALRKSRAYEAWGFSDLHDYCSKELSIRAATVDKLLLSFSAVQQHAPQVLQRDRNGVRDDVPSLDAVDYFNRALGSDERPGPFRRLDLKDDMLEQLRSAVFDEGQGVRELRERFRPILQPKTEAEQSNDAARKAKALATQLLALLPQLEISEARVGRVTAALEALTRDLDARSLSAKERDSASS